MANNLNRALAGNPLIQLLELVERIKRGEVTITSIAQDSVLSSSDDLFVRLRLRIAKVPGMKVESMTVGTVGSNYMGTAVDREAVRDWLDRKQRDAADSTVLQNVDGSLERLATDMPRAAKAIIKPSKPENPAPAGVPKARDLILD